MAAARLHVSVNISTACRHLRQANHGTQVCSRFSYTMSTHQSLSLVHAGHVRPSDVINHNKCNVLCIIMMTVLLLRCDSGADEFTVNASHQ